MTKNLVGILLLMAMALLLVGAGFGPEVARSTRSALGRRSSST